MAAFISSREKLERPMARIFPAFFSSVMVSIRSWMLTSSSGMG